ncbi:MAG: hypothetical protein AVDCRST_MAG64-3954 [uncultured Phycisphaerae bacterium]|uniref:Uncharacterized protein n=1 Tax=uncultured Phycisphaerae bacterium TaxID=904963 RepID=A0A6J4QIH5_9BACT|nr:MAG: hypothetical protein AVDCRST_MAG64-3954 [uncultured Phycisphaerae bacterium]
MSRNLLLQSILGHMDLLAERYPKKAASPVARRAKRYVKLSLHGAGAAPADDGQAPARPMRRAA